MNGKLALATASVALLASATAAATVPPTPTPNPTCTVIKRGVLGDIPDSYVWSLYPNYNDGRYVTTHTGSSSSGGEKRSLFGFDLSSIPAKATVASAKLNLSIFSNTTQTVRAHRVLGAWSETTVTWNNMPGIDPTTAASFVSGGGGWRQLVLTGVVQDWVNGTYPNYGILLEEATAGTTQYRSSNYGDASYYPWLEVCWTPPQSSIGDKVWFDTNADGVEDADEAGIANVAVSLYPDENCDSSADGGAVAQTTTDASGLYRFGGLNAGCYVVEVDHATLPSGLVLTSEAEPLDVAVGLAEDVTDADFGYYYAPSAIGDQVWLDGNGDGEYQPEVGEVGVNGVHVELYRNGALIATTVTGLSPYTGEPGFYIFHSDSSGNPIRIGDFEVRITADNFAPGGALAGMEPTTDLDETLDNATAVTLHGGEDFRYADFGYRHTCGNGVCGSDESCSSCATDCGTCPPVCGNGTCEGGESCSDCPEDCNSCGPVCGDGTCDATEDCQSCTADCGECPAVCGNSTCEPGESCSLCAQDCGSCAAVCGNGVCEGAEDCSLCPSDCGACPAVCGNGTCEATESCSDCADDCGICPPVCGNGTCENSETCSSCTDDCGVCPPVCGDGTCEGGELCDNCALDCGACPPVCGDGTCEGGESCSSCADDCGVCPPVCGNGTCEPGESCSDCAADCGVCPPSCGNGTCEAGETCSACSDDCGVCPPVCGNGTCEGGESCSDCASDCGVCPPVCGDGTCEGGESCSSCASDCGTCPPVCGDGTCEITESCSTCSSDCGACPPVCGNGVCQAGETCSSCSSDCGACPAVCGNGTCESGESCGTCPNDCGICPPVCGNGVCQVGETCASCRADCGACRPVCGDNVCSGDEDRRSCPADCGGCSHHSAPGTGTIGYWMNHPSAWPVDRLSIGGKVYTKAELIAIIKAPTKGDVTYIIAQQLIAAKLNVGAGNESRCISSTIVAADAWLVANRLGSHVKGGGRSSPWCAGQPLSERLDEYNNGELCAPHRR